MNNKLSILSKILKTFILIFIFLISVVFTTGCEFSFDSNDDENDKQEEIVDNEPKIDQEQIDFIIELINDLGSINLKDKEDVEYIDELYQELSEEEKALVTNIEELETAKLKIAYLEQEDKYINEGYQECINYLKTIIPETIENTINEIDIPTYYTYKTNFAEYNFLLKWTSSNINSLTSTGEVFHKRIDDTATLSCVISCTKLKETASFVRDVLVNKIETSEIDKPIVISYYYGYYSGISEVDANTIDIVNYSFAQIAKKTENSKTVYYIDVSGVPSINKVKELHEYGIKVCLSLGGWHDDSSFWDTYSQACSTDANRKMVASAILETLETYELDGIDMDWEYPKTSDRSNFTLLMKEIYQTLKAKNSEYIISGAFPYGTGINSRCDMASLNNYMDYFNLMTYDMDFDGSTVTKHMCEYKTTKSAITTALNLGISKEKIVIGMAFYARAFYGVSSTNNGLGQTCTSRKAINYQEVKNTYLSRLGTEVAEFYDSSKNSYYLYDYTNQVFISYESVQGIKNKYNLAFDEKIGGVMYWSYNNDSTGDYIKAISDAKVALDTSASN